MICEYRVEDASGVVVCGDIHGHFDELVDMVCDKHGMTDTVVVVAGDCGFGFCEFAEYQRMMERNADKLRRTNNRIFFVRGNHDNPAYFDGATICNDRFVAVPDYAVIIAAGHTVLCVGGALSFDRKQRLDELCLTPADADKFAKGMYWRDEMPFYDAAMLDAITEAHAIDTVVTHTAPSFCWPMVKDIPPCALHGDPNLRDDLNAERATIDRIYSHLTRAHQPLDRWYYGHIHTSARSTVGDTLFVLLSIMELAPLP